MEYFVNADGQVEFSFGSTRCPFELVFDVPALRHFMELAGNALVQVAASIVKGEPEDDEEEPEDDAGQANEQVQP